jgi:hypothetical protein
MRKVIVLVIGAAALAIAGCSSNSGSSGGDSGSQTPAPSFSQFTDLPVPENAHMDVGKTLVLGQGDNWVGRLVFDLRFSGAPSVFDFYKSEMPTYKWQEISSVRSDISVMTYRRGDRIATIEIEETTLSLGTEVTITMGPANGAANPPVSSDQPPMAQPAPAMQPPTQPVAPSQPITEQPLK